VSQKTLRVRLISQEEIAWCWAAAAEMVLKYYQKRGVGQCTLANYAFSRTDCCPRSSMPTACDNGIRDSDVGSVYNNWSVNATFNSGAVPFSVLKTEIDQARPVEVAYKLYGDGDFGHAVIVRGYRESQDGQFVTVNDPDPFGSTGELPFQVFQTKEGTGYWWRTWTGIA
jgi:hypothetical protein